MAYNFALSNVYNLYQSTYAPKNVSRYDAHKKSELRSVYHSIVKLNKESPLTIVDTSQEAQAYAVSLKENARQLRNTIASLGGLDEGDLLTRKTASSSNPDVLDVKYVGDTLTDEAPDTQYDITVKQLAKPQVNTGTYLNKKQMELPPGPYSFELEINHTAYEFQFNIGSNDTNLDLQKKLMRLINNSNLGINASLKEVNPSSAALVLESMATGIELGQNMWFDIQDSAPYDEDLPSVVDYLGLNQISVLPQNAVFTLNGENRVSNSNHFTLDKKYEITLKDLPDNNETITVGLKTDTESLSENVNRFVSGYNDFIRATAEYLGSQPKSSYLLKEMKNITASYDSQLRPLGLAMTETGEINVDESLLRDNIQLEDAREKFSSVRKFTNSVLNKTNSVALNPMEYVPQKIVAYKKPDATFATPYITSQYSGMMFNTYA